MTTNQIKFLWQFAAMFLAVVAAWAVTNWCERRQLADMAQKQQALSGMNVPTVQNN